MSKRSIDKSSRLPLYHQLVDVLLDDIEEGRILENQKLPSERELCEEFDISRATVRQAMSELEKSGRIIKEHGKGTFVLPKALNQDLGGFYSFTEEMKKLGKKPTSIILDFSIILCSQRIAHNLKLKRRDFVYEITRLRLADDEPMMYERSFLPCNRFAGFTKSDIEGVPMYEVFKSKFGVSFSKAEEKLKPVQTRAHEAKLLSIEQSMPSMMIERVTFEGEERIEYTISIARGDRFEYTVVLKNLMITGTDNLTS